MYSSILCILFIVQLPTLLWALTNKEILKRADRSRGNLDGVEWNLKVESIEKNDVKDRRLKVKTRGYDFLARMTDPPKVSGHKLLMVNHNMWFYKPGLSKPVPISPRQKLIGGASYGDIAATNYSNDYLIKERNDEKFNDEDCYVFDLKAAHKNVTYDRIKYWISKKSLVGVKAEYYTISRKMFKEAEFEYRHKIVGKKNNYPFISKMTIFEKVMPDNRTILYFSEPQLKEISPETFNLNLLSTR